MTEEQWQIFCNFKTDLKQKIDYWTALAPELGALQKKAAEFADTPLYPFEIPIVYNKALDDITLEDDIKLIVIGDNPGKDEQLSRNSRYLVGQAGKIAEGYFKKNPELGIDFRRNVIILNKTPVHSAKTTQLKTIIKMGGEKISSLIQESQIWMAEQTAALHAALNTELWLVGYSELKPKGIFSAYRETLKENCTKESWKRVFVFQHFSMNRFTIDLAEYIKNNQENSTAKSLSQNIHELGILHRKEIFL